MRLKAEHISYKYLGGSREVLSDVSLELGSTDRLGIAAPSGFGKTTLCQILAGYRTPTAGRVCVDDMPLPGSGYCPVQMIWQHPEKAVNPRLKMEKIFGISVIRNICSVTKRYFLYPVIRSRLI